MSSRTWLTAVSNMYEQTTKEPVEVRTCGPLVLMDTIEAEQLRQVLRYQADGGWMATEPWVFEARQYRAEHREWKEYGGELVLHVTLRATC